MVKLASKWRSRKKRGPRTESRPEILIQPGGHAHLESNGEETTHMTQLCERCSNLKLDAILRGTYQKDDSFQVEEIGKLGPISTWNPEACEFCRLFEAIIPSGEDDPYPRYFKLHAFDSHGDPSIYKLPFLKSIPSRVMLGLQSGVLNYRYQYLWPQLEDAGPLRLLKPDSIDFMILQDWLDICREKHTGKCSAKSGRVSSVQHLKLVDCETHEIVSANGHAYAALSYMCGQIEHASHDPDHLPSVLPSTIKDAITVTQNLGLRYLWIDRYCIDQIDEDRRNSQMGQMNLVYKNSEITIIAAAGKDPAYGLPGVSSRHRQRQPQVKIGKYLLASSLLDIHSTAVKSHWNTRGWTYQESLLSTRRIIFTDQQVYYECHGMFCYEVWDLPLRKMHTKNGQALESKYSTSYNGYEDKQSELRVFPPGVGLYPEEVYQHIYTYSKKSFSHTSDMLNAFLGILAAFEAGPLGLRNCFGTPIFPNPNISEETTTIEKMYPIAGFLKGLGWALSEDGKRQQNLPSWSWTGWVGSGINDNLIEREKWHLPTQKPHVKISIELSNGTVLDWDLFQARYAEVNTPSKLSGYLYVSTWAIPLRMRGRDGLRQNCEFDMNDGSYIVWSFLLHQDRDLSKARLLEPDRHYERMVNKGERLACNGDDLVEAGDSKSQRSSEGWVAEGEDASGEEYISDGETDDSVHEEDYPPEPPDSKKSLSEPSCYGLIIGENRSRSGYKDLFIVVVAEVNGRVERVGGDWTVFRLSLYSPEGVSMGSEVANGSKAIKKRYGKRWWLNAKSAYQTWRIG
jgi:hypothetical protein